MLPPTIKKIINHFGPATLDQAVVSATRLFIILFLAKLWDIKTFGQFSLIFLIISLPLEIQRACIISPMMSLGPKKEKQNRADYFSTLFYLNIFLGVLLSFFLMGFLSISTLLFPKWGIGSYAVLAGGFLIPRMIYEFYRRYFFVIDKQKIALFIDTINSLILILSIGGIYWQSGDIKLEHTIIVYAFSCLVSLCLGCFFFRIKRFDFTLSKAIVTEHWVYGRWLLATVGVQYATNNYLILMASAVIGPAVAGGIQIAQYIMGGLTAFYQALENVVPAYTAKLFHQYGFKIMFGYFIKIMTGLVILSLIYGAVIHYFIDDLVIYFVERDDPLTTSIVQGFTVLYLLLPITLCLVYALRAIENTRPIFIAYAITAALNVFLSQFLINSFGAMGVIYGMIGFQFVIISVYSAFLYRYKERI